MRFVSDKLIRIDKELSELDAFALDFVRIVEKYAEYVIVSGYVSILLGRARASEDIDIIIQEIPEKKFHTMVDELTENGFECLNTDSEQYAYLKEKTAVRFAKIGTVIPNIELKFPKNKIGEMALKNRIRVEIREKELYISQLELQIAFKEQVLRSPKDLEDARHLRNITRANIDNKLIKRYEETLNEFY